MLIIGWDLLNKNKKDFIKLSKKIYKDIYKDADENKCLDVIESYCSEWGDDWETNKEYDDWNLCEECDEDFLDDWFHALKFKDNELCHFKKYDTCEEYIGKLIYDVHYVNGLDKKILNSLFSDIKNDDEGKLLCKYLGKPKIYFLKSM